MMTARKRVRPLPTHRLAVRHSVDYSSLDHCSSDDSSRDSSSESSLDSSTDALSDSASSRSSSDHSLPTPSSDMRPSYHLCSLVPSIHRSSAAISDRPSHDSSSTSPSRKRSRSLGALTMPNTRSGASRTCEGISEQIDRQIAGALGARTTARNLEPLMRDGGGQEEGGQEEVNRNGGNGNGGNGNGGNGNGNENERGNGYNFGGFVPARECTYQDFQKCQPLSFNETEGVVGLTRWFDKMETVFHISNCPEKYQVKYASCTLLNSALTWWNSHKRTIGIEPHMPELGRNL
ncbi:hypothetical protein Tco_1172525 [Tanacetum coccineum]